VLALQLHIKHTVLFAEAIGHSCLPPFESDYSSWNIAEICEKIYESSNAYHM